jgi:hypothetical protein
VQLRNERSRLRARGESSWYTDPISLLPVKRSLTTEPRPPVALLRGAGARPWPDGLPVPPAPKAEAGRGAKRPSKAGQAPRCAASAAPHPVGPLPPTWPPPAATYRARLAPGASPSPVPDHRDGRPGQGGAPHLPYDLDPDGRPVLDDGGGEGDAPTATRRTARTTAAAASPPGGPPAASPARRRSVPAQWAAWTLPSVVRASRRGRLRGRPRSVSAAVRPRPASGGASGPSGPP